MPRFVGYDMSLYGPAKEGKIPQAVSKFMPDKFIGLS